MLPAWAWVLLGLLALQRVAELVVARRHTRRLLQGGARLVRDDAYARIVAVHVLFFLGAAVEGASAAWAGSWAGTWPLLLLFALAQALRLWTMRTLGPRWTVRVVVVPSAPLVTRGPFRFLRHPNYVAVAVELAVLPLALGLPATAVAVALLHAPALRARIRREEAALAASLEPTRVVGLRA